MHGLPLDDPAFSSDPHVHPFFDSPWSLKPDVPPRLLQPPTGPMLSDDHSSTTHESTSSSATTLSTPPTSTESHSPPWTPSAPEKSPQLRWPPEVHKKKKSLAMFWRRSPPETVLASVDLLRNVSPEPSLPRNMASKPTLPPAPSQAPNAIASSKRTNRSHRPPTSSAEFKPPPSASRRIAGGVTMRASELDRIDELDETNPVGVSLHHGGPYEAAHKPTNQEATENRVPHNIGSQYQLPMAKPKEDRPRDRKQERKHLHRRNLSDSASVPFVPAGVSLNLSPGQILPHNFFHQLNSGIAPTTAPSNAPGWPPQQYHPRYQPQDQPYSQPQPQPQTQPHLSSNQDIPINHDNQQARLDRSFLRSPLRNAPPEYSALPSDHYTVKDDPGNLAFFVAPSTSKYEGEELNYDPGDRKQSHQPVKEQQVFSGPINIPPDFRTPTPGSRHHHQSNNRLPPRMQALQMQIPRYDEKHRRPSRLPNGNPDYAVPIQGGHINQSNMPMVDDIHHVPLFVDRNGLPASAPAPPSFEIIHPIPIQDQIQFNDASQPSSELAQSLSRSIHSSSRSAKSGYPRGAPLPHHLPKRLVMPAPLQTSQPVAPRYQPQPQPPPRHLGNHPWQPQLRPPSPPDIPDALDFDIESQLRAEDVQMSQGRKLRKRSSANTAAHQPPFRSVSPSQPIPFEPTPTYHEVPSLQPLYIRKPDKVQKKVLSKRRLEY